MNALGALIILAGFAALLAGLATIVWPMPRFGFVFSSRWMGVLTVVVAFMMFGIAENVSPEMKANAEKRAAAAQLAKQQAETKARRDSLKGDLNRFSSNGRSAFQSSGGCRTDALGATKCDFGSTLNVGSYKSTSSATSTCRTSPLTGHYECKSDFNVR